MPATIVVNQPIVLTTTQTYDWDNYTLQVSGDASIGKRTCTIMCPIKGADGKPVSVGRVILEGAKFNEFWTAFSSDKTAVQAVMGQTQDVSTIPDSIVNTIK
jgi:hypothetical protein